VQSETTPYSCLWHLSLYSGSARASAPSSITVYGQLGESPLEDLKRVIGATLTLLGLIIGFTFSMAVSRYDQRKNLEEQEANAIGTEYVRADFLPAGNAATVRALLKSYLDQRILFTLQLTGIYSNKITSQTARLQKQMWSEVKGPRSENATPLAAIVAPGMNDVLNS